MAVAALALTACGGTTGSDSASDSGSGSSLRPEDRLLRRAHR
nr:hypothetical protein [Angustibacter aerolatus]